MHQGDYHAGQHLGDNIGDGEHVLLQPLAYVAGMEGIGIGVHLAPHHQSEQTLADAVLLDGVGHVGEIVNGLPRRHQHRHHDEDDGDVLSHAVVPDGHVDETA